MASLVSYLVSSPFIFIDYFKLYVNIFSYIQAFVFFINMVGVFFVTLIIKRVKGIKILKTGFGIIAVGTGGLLLVGMFAQYTLQNFVLFIAIFSFGLSLALSVLNAETLGVVPLLSGVASSFLAFSMSFFCTIGTTVISFAYHQDILTAVLVMTIMAYLSISAFLLR